MSELILHAFEAGRRGKPDEIDSQIANLIGAEITRRDPNARFDLRVNGYYSNVDNGIRARIAGEVSDFILSQPDFKDSVAKIVVEKYEQIYKSKLDPNQVIFGFAPQSDALSLNSQKEVAGDSGIAISVAYKHGPHYLPWERFTAVDLRDIIDNIYLYNKYPDFIKNPEDFTELSKLRADGKIEVTAMYEGMQFKGIRSIVMAVEQATDLSVETLRNLLSKLVQTYIDYHQTQWSIDLGKPVLIINGAGHWPEGGWKTDAGSREAKPYRDAFATYGVCEDSFSGEDPTKPSATASLLARYIAVSVVKSGLADFARVTLCYQLGQHYPILNIFTQNTATLPQDKLENLVSQKISLKFKDAIGLFNLNTPEHYQSLAEWSDYFQNPNFPWNQGINLV